MHHPLRTRPWATPERPSIPELLQESETAKAVPALRLRWSCTRDINRCETTPQRGRSQLRCGVRPVRSWIAQMPRRPAPRRFPGHLHPSPRARRKSGETIHRSRQSDTHPCRRSTCAWRQRQPHLKNRIARFSPNLNTAPVLFHNALHCIETQPSSLAHSLSGEEWFKNVLLDLGPDSRTVVADLHYDAIRIPISPHAQLALSSHRVDRVVDQVGPDLIEFAPKGVHQ